MDLEQNEYDVKILNCVVELNLKHNLKIKIYVYSNIKTKQYN